MQLVTKHSQNANRNTLEWLKTVRHNHPWENSRSLSCPQKY